MVRQSKVLGALAGLVVQGALAAQPPVKREEKADFEVDDSFQADGGVQIHFDLQKPGSTAQPPFRALDRDDRLGTIIKEPVHLCVMRVSYVVEKDVAFFTRERLLDLAYMRALAPQLQLSARADGGFQVGQSPASDLSLEFHDDQRGPWLVQENVNFARVLGWRTGAWSATWTFHESLGPGRTRVTALSLSYLYNVPPGFLGGADRFRRETIDGALEVITRLRGFKP
ncbi:MAG: hypothetical protein QM817_14425 [Archangium sp.]